MQRQHPVPRAALKKHIGILGKTGSGKSNLAKTIAEDLLGRGERVCVIDPTGTWWGLRLMADGKTPSEYPIVIFGGQHADLPASAGHGDAIAEVVATSSTPAVIDTRHMTVGERTRFFTAFAERLVRSNRGELTLVIDEAHLFVPQSGGRRGGDAPAMLHAGNNLVSLGRGIGLHVVLISQRPAKVHKDALTQVETLVAMRLIAPQDRKAIGEWIDEWAKGQGEHGDITTSLPSLPTGDAWVWSPEIDHLARVHCPLAATYDSGRVRNTNGPSLRPIDVGEIAARLETGAGIVAGDDDPKRLRRRIAELERKLRESDAAAGGINEAEVERRIAAAIQPWREALDKAVKTMTAAAEGLSIKIEPPEWDAPPAVAARPPARRRYQIDGTPDRNSRAQPASAAKPARQQKPNNLPGPQHRILDALAWLASLGVTEHANRIQVAFLAGYKPGGGAFNNTLGAMRRTGLIEYPGTREVKLTDKGRGLANEPEPPLTNEALHKAVLERLTGPQRRVLQPLITAWPHEMTTGRLAEAAGYEAGGGAFNNTRGSLRSLGLIEYPGAGRVRARSVLFTA